MTFARFGVPAIVGLILAAQAVPLAQAQDYPTRPVTLIAPWPAGGAIDTLCRILAPKLSDRLGKSVIIENRAGAASVIGKPSPSYTQFVPAQIKPALIQSGMSSSMADLILEMSVVLNSGYMAPLERRSAENTTPIETFVAEEFLPRFTGKAAGRIA